MTKQQEILKDHYLALTRKITAFSGMFALLFAMLMIPVNAHAAQLQTRKAILSNSAGGATSVSYDIQFNIGSTSAANGGKSFRLQFCSDGPLYNTTCTLPSGLVRGTTISTQTINGGAFTNSYSAATNGTTDVLLTNATGNTLTSGQTVRLVMAGFTNPTAVNTQFYIRVITCSDTTCTVGAGSNMDNGGIAVSTTQTLSVTASVQEDLTFCVGTGITTNCGSITGTTLTLSPNPMTTSAPSTGTAKMAASTNGTGGYVITYNATSFTNGTDTITPAATGGVAINAGGTEQFGFNLVANSAGNFGTVGANASGGSGTATAPYATNNQIAYNTGGATQVASASGPSVQTTFTMSFGANVATGTKAGVYTATQTFIATATF